MELVDSFSLPDELWIRIKPLLPDRRISPGGGRPAMDQRTAFTALFYILRTGCQWKALPRSLGASSTVYGHFRRWVDAGVFAALWQQGLCEYDRTKGIGWKWQSVDGCMTKAPLGGEATGPNPTDRSKTGTKRSLLTDANGIPLALVIDGANRHDVKMLERTLQRTMAERPDPNSCRQHLCLDKGYEAGSVRRLVLDLGYTPHVKSRQEEKSAKRKRRRSRARRWVVERAHSWLNRFRRLLVRWEKRLDRYEGFLHLACAIIVWRRMGVFG